MTSRSPWLGVARSLASLAAALFASGALLAALLTVVAETTGGRLTGLGCLLGFSSATVLVVAPFLPSGRQALQPGVVGLVLMTVLVGIAASLTPSGIPSGDSRIRSVWPGPATYPRFALANIVPEVDPFTLGSYLVPIDPFVDLEQSRRIRALFQVIYRDLRADPDFLATGSSMAYSYRDLWTGSAESGHLYVVLPEHPRREERETVVFLHGTLGAFKGYAWVLRGLADRCQVAVVAPDFGAGFWFRPGGVEAIEAAVHWAEAEPGLASPRTLIGLSGGGYGVSRAAVELPDQWASVVYLSGILERDWMPQVAHASDRPVTVLWGAQDRRLPNAHTTTGIAALQKAGAHVQTRVWPEEDHFLFFSQPDAVLDELARAVPGCSGAPDRKKQ